MSESYKGVEAAVKIVGAGNEEIMSFRLAGMRLDQKGGLKGVPEYLKELAKEKMVGLSNAEIEGLKKRIADLEKSLEKRDDQIEELSKKLKGRSAGAAK
jgi:uncharacterized coiled-coil protein SlyX